MAVDLSGQLERAMREPELVQAATVLRSNQLAVAERLLRKYLHARPTDVPAIRMLAEVAGRLGRYADAEVLLARALELAPGFDAARANYVTVLQRRSKFAAARAEADRLLAKAPDDPGYLALKAGVLVRTGDYEEAMRAYGSILARDPGQARLWISFGHVLKTVGRREESVAAYRRAIATEPTLGDAWWSLANLKTAPFDAGDVSAMEAALAQATDVGDRYHLHFALGKALEDARDYPASFAHYDAGNRLRRAELPYDAAQTSAHAQRTAALMTTDAFVARPGGEPSPDPIFVVGLPRAGSTLIEQILASHSAVEGTMELPDIAAIATELAGREAPRREDEHGPPGYLPRLLAQTAGERAALGRRYIERTRIQRKTARPYFVDKMPNNFAHIGLIHQILPNAKIIDARRHPMANGFSAWKQHFARGQGFSYDLGEVGRYYADYVAVMDHYDRVLPGRVHRVHYEAMVANPEREVRAMLVYCGLAFEPECMAFHENRRAVRTASSEQVRRPISAEAVDHWRNYEPWLGPLRDALGDLPERYPYP